MSFDGIATSAITVAILGLLFTTRLAPDAVFVAALGVLVLLGVLEPAEALVGFTNEGLATIAILYVVARGVKDTGLIGSVGRILFGRPRSLTHAQFKLMTPVAAASAFMSNTPVVAVLIPAISDWAKRHQLHVAQLMMPLSFAAIIGGTCTLIGTSTNLIINGMVLETGTLRGFGLFELAWLGLPCVLVVILLTMYLSQRLLPKEGPTTNLFADARQYSIAMEVDPACPLIGQTVEEAGLRGLSGLFLAEITRGETLLPAVNPEEVLVAGDRLLFAGNVDSVVDLQRIEGLVPATDQVDKVAAQSHNRLLVEVVVSRKCPVVGKTIRAGKFRSIYNAAIIALARDGEQVNQKIGDIVLKAGDMLLLDTHQNFAQQQRNRGDFLFVNSIEGSKPYRSDRRMHAAMILVGMVLLAATGLMGMLEAVILAAGLMVLFGCTSIANARRSVDLEVILTIGAAVGLALALKKTGVIAYLVEVFLFAGGHSVWLTLALVYLVTALLTAILSNAATAVILFPAVLGIAQDFSVDPTAFIVALMFGASASFATPIGYQTNLMVFGPGGYHFADFLRVGVPVTLVVGVMVVLLAPIIWPF